MKIYANIDSEESVSYLKNYDPYLIKIEMSSSTKKSLNMLKNMSIKNWFLSHNIDIDSNYGEGIVCGVIE